jgi:CheY-like chemotaxis protein
VLVVDDDPGIRSLVRSVLTEEGYRVQTAANGAAALEVLRLVRPDAIMLDVQMPVMGGWAFRAEQLALAGAREIPVVLATASGRTEPPSAELAPTAVLLKPFDVGQLLATLAGVLGARAVADGRFAVREPPADATPPSDPGAGAASG